MKLSMRSCSVMENKERNSIVIVGHHKLCGDVKRFLIKEEYIFKGFNIPGTDSFGVEVRFEHDYDIEAFLEKWDTACKISSRKVQEYANSH